MQTEIDRNLFEGGVDSRKQKEIKDLTDEFYRSRKDKGPVASSYSYECKECTKERISKNRKNKSFLFKYEYPDW